MMVNVNKNGATAEYLRLNTGLPITPRGSQNSLGAAACFVNAALKLDNATADGNPDNDCDPAGFPNGRRLWDDIVDLELRAVAEGYGTFLNDNFGLPNNSPNNLVGDGCDANDKTFLTTFPYVAAPWAGYKDGVHHHSPCEALDETSTAQ